MAGNGKENQEHTGGGRVLQCARVDLVLEFGYPHAEFGLHRVCAVVPEVFWDEGRESAKVDAVPSATVREESDCMQVRTYPGDCANAYTVPVDKTWIPSNSSLISSESLGSARSTLPYHQQVSQCGRQHTTSILT